MGYFKGCYFKCCTGDKTIAFIPAYHCCDNKKSASLQIITDDAVFHIPFHTIKYKDKPLYIKLGDCRFTEQGISLNYHSNHLNVKGALYFQPLSPIRYDIMGPFALVPFMQCRHSVYSMTHKIDGQLLVNNKKYTFQNGIGYMEGDRGYSFPKQYIWTQCCFAHGSLMLSVADIPMFGLHFTGIIGVVLLHGKEYRIATYLGAKVTYIGTNTVTIKQGDYTLTAQLQQKRAQPLWAPSNGNMCRTIHESAACQAYYRFSYKQNVLCEFSSNQASFEFEFTDKDT